MLPSIICLRRNDEGLVREMETEDLTVPCCRYHLWRNDEGLVREMETLFNCLRRPQQQLGRNDEGLVREMETPSPWLLTGAQVMAK